MAQETINSDVTAAAAVVSEEVKSPESEAVVINTLQENSAALAKQVTELSSYFDFITKVFSVKMEPIRKGDSEKKINAKIRELAEKYNIKNPEDYLVSETGDTLFDKVGNWFKKQGEKASNRFKEWTRKYRRGLIITVLVLIAAGVAAYFIFFR